MARINCSKISLLVPSLNRAEFLKRLLNYYREVNFQGHILIGDSSNESQSAQIKLAIKRLGDSLTVKYFECRELNDSEAIGFLSHQATTPYVAFVADDDFLIPEGIADAISFLDNHDDYSVAHGQAALFVLNASGAYGELDGIANYSLRSLEQITASDRLKTHLNQYFVTLFSVHRVEQHRSAYKDISNLTDKSFTELLPSCMASIQGKVKQLDSLYLIRQAHDARYFLPGFMDWISKSGWPDSYEMFRNSLAMELAARDAISGEEAKTIIQDAFRDYIANCFFLNQSGRQTRLNNCISSIIHKSNLLLMIWHGIRCIVPQEQHRFNLRNFRNTSFKYYEEFRPIYEIVTGHK